MGFRAGSVMGIIDVVRSDRERDGHHARSMQAAAHDGHRFLTDRCSAA
jgi:hypothetical protein